MALTSKDQPDSRTESEVDVDKLVSDWVDDNWDPDLTLGEWWQRLAESGFAHPSLPADAYGLGWSQAQALQAMRVLAQHKVVGPAPGLGYMLAAPTIADHGSQRHTGCQGCIGPAVGGNAGRAERACNGDITVGK